MFAKFDLAEEIFTVCKHKFAQVVCNCQSHIKSSVVEKESTANSILITQPKSKEVLNVLDTIQRHLQCEGADIETFFFCSEKQLQESIQNSIKHVHDPTTCLPHEGGGIPLSALPKDTTSKLTKRKYVM